MINQKVMLNNQNNVKPVLDAIRKIEEDLRASARSEAREQLKLDFRDPNGVRREELTTKIAGLKAKWDRVKNEYYQADGRYENSGQRNQTAKRESDEAYDKMISLESEIKAAEAELAQLPIARSEVREVKSEVDLEKVKTAAAGIVGGWKYVAQNGNVLRYGLQAGTMDAVAETLEAMGDAARPTLENPARLAKLALIYESLKGTLKSEELAGKYKLQVEQYVKGTVTEPLEAPESRKPEAVVEGMSVSGFFKFGGSILEGLRESHRQGLTHFEASFDILPFAAGFAPASVFNRRLANEYSKEEIEAIREFVKATGMQLTFHSPIVGPSSGFQPLFEDATDNLELMKEQINVAGQMGAIGMVVHLSDPSRAADYAELVLYANQVSQEKALGMAPNFRINFENYYDKTPGKKNFPTAGRFMDAFEDVFKIVKEKDSEALKNLGIVLDAAHYNLTPEGEDPVVSAYTIAQRLRTLAEVNPGLRKTVLNFLTELHLNENIGPMEFYLGFSADLHLSVSTMGPIDIAAVIAVLAHMGLHPFATVEQASELSAADIEFMRKALARAADIRERIEKAGGEAQSVMDAVGQQGDIALGRADLLKYKFLFDAKENRAAYRLMAGLVGADAFGEHMERRVIQKIFLIRSEQDFNSLKALGLTFGVEFMKFDPQKEILTQETTLDPTMNESIAIYLLLHGKVDGKVWDPVTDTFHTFTIPAGKFFGERKLLTGEPRNATVTAVEYSTALKIPLDAVVRIKSLMPDFGDLLIQFNVIREKENTAAVAAAKAAMKQVPPASSGAMEVPAWVVDAAVSGQLPLTRSEARAKEFFKAQYAEVDEVLKRLDSENPFENSSSDFYFCAANLSSWQINLRRVYLSLTGRQYDMAFNLKQLKQVIESVERFRDHELVTFGEYPRFSEKILKSKVAGFKKDLNALADKLTEAVRMISEEHPELVQDESAARFDARADVKTSASRDAQWQAIQEEIQRVVGGRDAAMADLEQKHNEAVAALHARLPGEANESKRVRQIRDWNFQLSQKNRQIAETASLEIKALNSRQLVLRRSQARAEARSGVEARQELAKAVWEKLSSFEQKKLLSMGFEVGNGSLAEVLGQIVVPVESEGVTVIVEQVVGMLRTLLVLQTGEFDANLFITRAQELMKNPAAALSDKMGATVIASRPTFREAMAVLRDFRLQTFTNSEHYFGQVIAIDGWTDQQRNELEAQALAIQNALDYKGQKINSHGRERFLLELTTKDKLLADAKAMVSIWARKFPNVTVSVLLEGVDGTSDEFRGTILKPLTGAKGNLGARRLAAIKASQYDLITMKEIPAELLKELPNVFVVKKGYFGIDDSALVDALERVLSALIEMQATAVAA
jgi:sugar phosphate isomerase/epimerase/CRP-like cAMP-binding protein